MSLCVCQRCDVPVDSNHDPDCFVEVGNMRRLHWTIVLCAACREHHHQEQEDIAHAGP